MVPPNTLSPTALSTGRLSPVTGAWFTALAPAVTVPSSGIRPPGRTRTVAPSGTSFNATVCQPPPGWRMSASSGASAIRPLMALRARSTAIASISSAMEYSAITMAASGHWPIRKAPVTATVISALMLSRRLNSAVRPFWYTSSPAR